MGIHGWVKLLQELDWLPCIDVLKAACVEWLGSFGDVHGFSIGPEWIVLRADIFFGLN